MMKQNKLVHGVTSIVRAHSTIIVCSFIVLVIFTMQFVIAYHPFCRMKMLESDFIASAGPCEYVLDYGQRLIKYSKTIFLTKGQTFEITCNGGEKVTLHIGWDDCVYIKKGDEEEKMHITKVEEFYGKCPAFRRSGDSYTIDTDDYRLYSGLKLTAPDNSRLFIYKQPNGMPFGRQEYGFFIIIRGGEWYLMSGEVNLFDY